MNIGFYFYINIIFAMVHLFAHTYNLSNDFCLELRLLYSYVFPKGYFMFQKFVAGSGMVFPTSCVIFKIWNHSGGKKAPTGKFVAHELKGAAN
jgi:hypothetical protein